MLADPAWAGEWPQDKPLDAKLGRLEGGKVKLSELRGQPLLLKLWATWCIPCRQQAEILDSLEGVLTERGIATYAVDVGEKNDAVRGFLGRNPSRFPVLLDKYLVLNSKLKVRSLPTLVLLRADGTVAATAVGVTPRERVIELLDQLAGPAAD